jgi:hypothetical protein
MAMCEDYEDWATDTTVHSMDDNLMFDDSLAVDSLDDDDNDDDYDGQPLAYDARQFHAKLKRNVKRYSAMDDQIRCYIKGAYYLFETKELGASQVVRHIFRDLKRFPLRLLHASFEAFPSHLLIVPFDSALYSLIYDVFLEVAAEIEIKIRFASSGSSGSSSSGSSSSGSGSSRKRSFES